MNEKEEGLDRRTEHPCMPQQVTLQGRKEGDKHRSRTVPAEWPETAADGGTLRFLREEKSRAGRA